MANEYAGYIMQGKTIVDQRAFNSSSTALRWVKDRVDTGKGYVVDRRSNEVVHEVAGKEDILFNGLSGMVNSETLGAGFFKRFPVKFLNVVRRDGIQQGEWEYDAKDPDDLQAMARVAIEMIVGEKPAESHQEQMTDTSIIQYFTIEGDPATYDIISTAIGEQA